MNFLGTALALLASSSVVLALPGLNAAQISCAVVRFPPSLPLFSSPRLFTNTICDIQHPR